MKGQVFEAIEASREGGSSSPELFKSICSLRYNKECIQKERKIGTYTSDDPAVPNHITKHMKTNEISCMTACFSFSETSLPYKGMFTQELFNQEFRT